MKKGLCFSAETLKLTTVVNALTLSNKPFDLASSMGIHYSETPLKYGDQVRLWIRIKQPHMT